MKEMKVIGRHAPVSLVKGTRLSAQVLATLLLLAFTLPARAHDYQEGTVCADAAGHEVGYEKEGCGGRAASFVARITAAINVFVSRWLWSATTITAAEAAEAAAAATAPSPRLPNPRGMSNDSDAGDELIFR